MIFFIILIQLTLDTETTALGKLQPIADWVIGPILTLLLMTGIQLIPHSGKVKHPHCPFLSMASLKPFCN